MEPIISRAPLERPTENRDLTRIVLTGSESTGKSSLARVLADHFSSPSVAEYARVYAERDAGLRALTAQDLEPIAHGQIQLEDRVFHSAAGIVILDTDLVSTLVYAEHYYGLVPDWLRSAASRRLADLYLLCDIDLAWVADAVRDSPQQRRKLHEAFVGALEGLGAVYRTVTGAGPVRAQRALALAEEWLTSSRT
ncbi:MAG: AAA family ATPase [Gemmatimonadaceae bacterium]